MLHIKLNHQNLWACGGEFCQEGGYVSKCQCLGNILYNLILQEEKSWFSSRINSQVVKSLLTPPPNQPMLKAHISAR